MTSGHQCIDPENKRAAASDGGGAHFTKDSEARAGGRAGRLLLAPAGAHAQPRAVIAFLPAIERSPLPENASQAQKDARKQLFERESTLNQLAQRPQLALGFNGATQGAYSRVQSLLDMTQGTRVSKSAYKPPAPPELGFVISGDSGRILDWALAAKRAANAPADTVRACSRDRSRAVRATWGSAARASRGRWRRATGAGASRRCRSGPPPPWASASSGCWRTAARGGVARLRPARRARTGPDPRRAPARRAGDRHEGASRPLLAAAPADGDRGDRDPDHSLTSDTTRRQYIVAGIDILPTVLDHLGIAIPDKVVGQPIRVSGERDVDAMRDIEGRLRVINGRRIPALKTFLLAWLALLVALRLAAGRPGLRYGHRIGALGLLWVPSMLLLTAALAPTRNVEFAIVTVGCLGLGALTDALLPWPRGPLLPALIGLAAYTFDLANDSTLIVQSLLGPNPRFGSRYYGLGNELEASLPILMLFGLAAALTLRDGPGRRCALRRGASRSPAAACCSAS